MNGRLVVFCCERSGIPAWRQAEAGGGLPEAMQVVSVPCAGRIGVVNLLKAFEEGAAGVMVFACMQDSCQSLRGNVHAEKRTESARQVLAAVGMAPERLECHTISPPMAQEFRERVWAMMGKVGVEESKG